MHSELDPARTLALAECLAARLCHDFSGLAATIAGTLEMALEDMPAPSEASVLAMAAAAQLAARVKLYRAAWGGGDMEEDPVAALAEGLPNGSRLRLTIAPGLAASLDASGRRLLLCLLLAATSGMPSGGSIAVAQVASGFSLVLEGRRPAWPAAWPDGAAATPADLGACIDAADPRGLAAPMAALVAAASGWRLSVDGLCLTARRG